MKTLAWILTAAAVLVGADAFIMSSEPTTGTDATIEANGPIQTAGTSGIPEPPPDAHE